MSFAHRLIVITCTAVALTLGINAHSQQRTPTYASKGGLRPVLRITGIPSDAATGQTAEDPSGRYLRYPNGLTVDNSNNIYVVDTGHDRVLKFDRSGRFLEAFGGYGSGDQQLHYPMDIALDARNCRLFIADTMNHRVQTASCDGRFQGVIGQGDRRSRSGLNSPHGLFVDSDGTLLVADTANHRVVRFSGDGRMVASWGGLGTGNGQMQFPHDLVTDAQGNVYVTDFLNHRVQKFSRDGRYLAQWGRFGTARGQFNHPWGIAIDASGRVWVADMSNHRLQVFDRNGRSVGTFGTYQKIFGGAEATPNRPAIEALRRITFDHPKGLSFHGGILAVAHPGAHSVDLFRP